MSDQPYRRYICIVCGYIYDEAEGDPDGDLPPGTRFEDIPDDWYCPVCGVTKADFELLEDQAPAAAAAPPAAPVAGTDDPEALVIIGAGVAGWGVAEAYRREDPNRSITLISLDDAAAYPKPSLSNALQSGKTPSEIVETSGDERARALGVRLRPFTRVLSVDASRQRVITAEGGIPYGDLVLATGARPSVPPLAGNGTDNIRTVNGLEAYRQWHDALVAGAGRITVLGTGLVGTEMAEDLNAAGYEVVMADPAATPLQRFLPALIGEQLAQALTHAGLDVRCGTTVQRVDQDDNGVFQVTASDGQSWYSDLVLSATGLKPVVDLAQSAGASVGHGVQVDRWLRTTVPNIYAVGDGAEVDGQCFAFIEPIQRQARALAATLAGRDEPFDPLPPFIRVKSPSLPLAVCPPQDGAPAQWHEAEHAGSDRLMLCYRGDTLVGFAASGGATSQGGELYQQVRDHAKAQLHATAS